MARSRIRGGVLTLVLFGLLLPLRGLSERPFATLARGEFLFPSNPRPRWLRPGLTFFGLPVWSNQNFVCTNLWLLKFSGQWLVRLCVPQKPPKADE